MPGPVYDYDESGTLAANLIEDESHPSSNVYGYSHHILIPDVAPFHLDNLSLKISNGIGADETLQPYIDYYPCLVWVGASRSLGKMLYAGLALNRPDLIGNFKITYQTIGGEFACDSDAVYVALTEQVYNPRRIPFDLVTNVPNAFPPPPHDHIYGEVLGQSDLVDAVQGVTTAIATANVDKATTNYVAGLFSGKSARTHTHSLSSITGLQPALASIDNKVQQLLECCLGEGLDYTSKPVFVTLATKSEVGEVIKVSKEVLLTICRLNTDGSIFIPGNYTPSTEPAGLVTDVGTNQFFNMLVSSDFVVRPGLPTDYEFDGVIFGADNLAEDDVIWTYDSGANRTYLLNDGDRVTLNAPQWSSLIGVHREHIVEDYVRIIWQENMLDLDQTELSAYFDVADTTIALIRGTVSGLEFTNQTGPLSPTIPAMELPHEDYADIVTGSVTIPGIDSRVLYIKGGEWDDASVGSRQTYMADVTIILSSGYSESKRVTLSLVP